MKAIDTGFIGTVTLTRPVTALCPVDGVRDWYNLTVQYRPQGDTIELTWFSGFLDGFATENISQEDLCGEIGAELEYRLNTDGLRVTLEGAHAGIDAVTEYP